jgi:TolB-like protein/Tfp pilus assembly protein PilF
MNFLERVKNSNLFKVIALYVGGLWGAVQVLDFLVDRFHFPGYLLILVIIIGLSFFPLAIAISLYSIRYKILLPIFFACCSVATIFIVNKVNFGEPFQIANLNLKPKSIAVLPFTNLMNDSSQNYISDGLSEEILNNLAKISDLTVKSRKSTLKYKNSKKSSQEIGAELGVTTLLEGSIRIVDDRIRVSVQLIDAATETHIWSETFDRVLNDLLTLQQQISKETSALLKVKFTPKEKQDQNLERIVKPEAYDYYLRARYILNNFSVNGEKEYRLAYRLLLKSITEDPYFAESYSSLGAVLFTLRGFGVSRNIWLDSALLVTNQSIELNPRFPEGYLLRSWISMNYLSKIEESRRDLQHAYDLSPNDPAVLRTLGYALLQEKNYNDGASKIVKAIELKYTRRETEYYIALADLCIRSEQFSKADKLLSKAEELDPYSISVINYKSWNYFESGDYSSVKDLFLKHNEKVNDRFSFLERLGWACLMTNDLAKAEECWGKFLVYEKDLKDTLQYISARHRLAFVYWKQGKAKEADVLFKEQLRRDHENQLGLRGNTSFESKTYFYDLSAVYSFLGEKEKSLNWLDSAATKGFYWYWGIRYDPLLDNIRNEPRFREITNRKQQDFRAFQKAFESALNSY